MKKIIIAFMAVLLTSVSVHAQFEQGKYYGGLSVSGLDVNYNKADKWNVGVNGQLGYLFMDDFMVLANLNYSYQAEHSALSIGPALRYYIEQNGIFLGVGANYVHRPSGTDELAPHLSVGYAFFLNGSIALEPEIYYNQSFKNHDYSGIGLRVGLGIYF